MLINKTELEEWLEIPLSKYIKDKIIKSNKNINLLLFDLDGTLHAHGKILTEDRYTPTFNIYSQSGKSKKVSSVRHHAGDVLNRLASLDNIIVGFYTSCMNFTAEQIISANGLFQGTTFNPDHFFPFFSRLFNKRDLSPIASHFDTLRDLDGVISSANELLHVNGLDSVFSRSNVFLIDNEKRKVAEYVGNYYIVPTWESTHTHNEEDTTLLDLAEIILKSTAEKRSIKTIFSEN